MNLNEKAESTMRELYVNLDLMKKISLFTAQERRQIVETLDLMQSIGQFGMPLLRKVNIWRIRIGEIRIIFELKSDKITILDFRKGISLVQT